MNRLERNVWLVAAIIFAVVATIYTLSYIVIEPAHILPDIGGDGAKNNFTYLYHSLFGSATHRNYWFDGMNYPYGEHIVYTDGQPLLSVLFASAKNVTTGQALTVLWRLIGLSYVLAIVFVYRILTHFKVSPAPSIVFAAAIVIICPQILCLEGHYALGYTCIIPMLFYWTILYHQQRSFRYCAYVFVMGVVTAFLHPYYMAVILVWVMCYSLGYFIFIKQAWRDKVKHTLPLFVSAIAVFLLVTVIMKCTDPTTDRPQTPFADRSMYTTPHKLFTSYYSPAWRRAIDMRLVSRVSTGGEGFAYIGIVSAVTIVLSMLFFGISKLRKKGGDDITPEVFSPIWLFIAFVVLILSMGIPFIWNMEWLMDYFSVFKQFRTLGRFAWIFYYVITIYSAVVIHALSKRLIAGKKVFYGYSLLILALCIWVYEARGYIRFSRHLSREAAYHYDVMYSKHEQNWESFLKEKHFKREDFQAILLLPFFHIGTEKLWIGDPGWLNTLGTRAGLQLHLPMINVMMSRSSWSVAQKQVKVIAGPFSDKSILRDIKSNKPFLLFSMNKDLLAIDQDYLLGSSDLIGDFSDGKVYALYPERLAANDRRQSDSVKRIIPFMRSADTFLTTNDTRYIDHFDKGAANEHLAGTGAGDYLKQDSSLIATIPVHETRDSVPYEFSCWFLLAKEDYKSPQLVLECYSEAGKLIRPIQISANESVDSHGMWFRASRYFNMPSGCRYIKCILHDKQNRSYVAMDELLLCPADALVISNATDGTIMVNNHVFKTAKQ